MGRGSLPSIIYEKTSKVRREATCSTVNYLPTGSLYFHHPSDIFFVVDDDEETALLSRLNIRSRSILKSTFLFFITGRFPFKQQRAGKETRENGKKIRYFKCSCVRGIQYFFSPIETDGLRSRFLFQKRKKSDLNNYVGAAF